MEAPSKMSLSTAIKNQSSLKKSFLLALKPILSLKLKDLPLLLVSPSFLFSWQKSSPSMEKALLLVEKLPLYGKSSPAKYPPTARQESKQLATFLHYLAAGKTVCSFCRFLGHMSSSHWLPNPTNLILQQPMKRQHVAS